MGETRKQRSSVNVKIKANILQVKLCGVISKKDADRIYTDIRFGVADLNPGFTVITDIRDCKFAYLTAIPVYKSIVAFLQEKQVGRIIRVTGHSRTITNQIVALSRILGIDNAELVKSMEEAENLLQNDGTGHQSTG